MIFCCACLCFNICICCTYLHGSALGVNRPSSLAHLCAGQTKQVAPQWNIVPEHKRTPSAACNAHIMQLGSKRLLQKPSVHAAIMTTSFKHSSRQHLSIWSQRTCLVTLSLCPCSATIHHVYTCYMFTWLIADGHRQLSEWQIKILICRVTQRTVAVYRVVHIVYTVALRGGSYHFISRTCAQTQKKTWWQSEP